MGPLTIIYLLHNFHNSNSWIIKFFWWSLQLRIRQVWLYKSVKRKTELYEFWLEHRNVFMPYMPMFTAFYRIPVQIFGFHILDLKLRTWSKDSSYVCWTISKNTNVIALFSFSSSRFWAMQEQRAAHHMHIGWGLAIRATSVCITNYIIINCVWNANFSSLRACSLVSTCKIS